MASLNKVMLAGNLTREPEGKRTTSGTSVCGLGMAVNRKWRNAAGEMQDETTFVDIEVWGQPADFCRDYLHKGNAVLIEGRLKLESWEDRETGQKRSKMKVVAERVQSLTSRDHSQPAAPAAVPASDAFDVSDESIDQIPF